MSFSVTRLLVFCAIVQLLAVPALADLVTFTDGDSFDGDQATQLFDSSDQAGPLGSNGVILRTVKINGVDSATEANQLETTGGKIGIDSAAVNGGEKNNWDDGESWTYEYNQATLFDEINFGGLTGTDAFSVQSNSFIGFIAGGPLGTGVTFDTVSGTWTFDGTATNDHFTVAELGGIAARVLAFDDITISFSGSSSATVQGIGVTSVPEPGCVCFLLALGLGVSWRRKQTS